jgi:hypothetical protein
MPFARTAGMRRVSTLGLLGSLALMLACGGGNNTSNPNPIVTATQNTQPIVVNGGPPAAINLAGIYPNGAFTSVTVCVPGSTTSCQSIDGILVDTGSFGLRILASSSGGELTLALPSTTINGQAVAECTVFADHSFIWGPVETADVKIAGEQASSLPVNVIGDTSFSPVPSGCSSGGGTDDDSIAALGANGILGVGSFSDDCGSACAPSAVTPPTGDPYYGCSSSGCQTMLVGLSQQVQNPVSLFAADNNGVILKFPSVSAPQPSVTGSMVFGIGTQADNSLGSAIVFPLDPSTFDITTTYNNVAYPGSFIDSGSNGIFFLDTATTGLQRCPDTAAWYCPSSPINIPVANQATGGSPDAFTFTVGNFDQLTAGSNAAIPNSSGPDPGVFDFGLPFFYGRNVFTSIQGTTAPGGQTPYWAY